MDKMMNRLPKDWKYRKLEDVLQYIQPTKYIVKSTNYSSQYKTPVLTAGKTFLLGNTNEEDGIFTDIPVIIFDDFTTANKYVNFKFKVKSSAMKILKLSSKDADLKFIFYYMQTVKISNTTHKRYWISIYAKEQIALPSLVIQQQIVAKIETLFTQIDAALQTLQTLQQQNKLYRQTILQQAFEGKLVNVGEMKWVKLDELTEVKDGTHDSPKYIANGIPFVTQKNIKESGLNFDDIRYITHEDHSKFYKRSNVAQNDILISMIGANRGMCCIVKDTKVFSIKNVGLVKSNSKVLNQHYLLYFLKSQFAKNYIKSLSKGGAQEFVGLTELRNFPIIITSIQNQQLIVQAIEKHLSVADNFQTTIAQSIAQAKALKQSILQKAFSGQLV